jgi:hypothetical protein
MLVDHLRQEFGPKSNVAVACVYCDYKLVKAKKQSAENLLASLWKDLAINNGPLSEVVKNIHEKNKGRDSRPALNEVSKALHFEIGRYSKVFIILDALDECPEGDVRDNLVDELLALPKNAKLMVTSRPHLNIQQYFEGVNRLEVRATENDLQTFLEGQMHRFNKCVKQDLHGENLRELIINTIISCADGM